MTIIDALVELQEVDGRIRELELELKSGDAAAFDAYAQALEQRFSLIPQPLSKLARAIAAGTAQSKEPSPA